MKFLGIDIGTGGTRAIVIDHGVQVVASKSVDHIAFASPHIGWAEQDPRDWWRASVEAIRGDVAASLRWGLSGKPTCVANGIQKNSINS